MIRDITKLKELKDNLKKTNSMYHRERVKNRTILDNIPSGVYTVDREMKFLSFNRSLESITGYSAEEVLGKRCTEILRSDFCEAGCPLKRSMRTGETLRGIELNLRARDGSVVPIASSTAVLRDEEGRPIGGICSFRDLRELHAVPFSQGHAREFQGMLSKNPKMHEIFDLIETVAESDANVLIEGESGTGKELVARAIHRLSARAGKPFLGVNCASLNENLMESELFGHVRGAFTGAVKDRMGRFEMAEGGTLFLDEVSEIGLHLQAKLLRVIQEREYHRVGETGARKANVRILSATNKRLKELIAGRTFRDDLYYRLNVVSVTPPPLRERKEDIPILVEHFLCRPQENAGGVQAELLPAGHAGAPRIPVAGQRAGAGKRRGAGEDLLPGRGHRGVRPPRGDPPPGRGGPPGARLLRGKGGESGSGPHPGKSGPLRVEPDGSRGPAGGQPRDPVAADEAVGHRGVGWSHEYTVNENPRDPTAATQRRNRR